MKDVAEELVLQRSETELTARHPQRLVGAEHVPAALLEVAAVSDLVDHLASGDLAFARAEAPVELRYFRPDGQSLLRHFSMSAWTTRYVKIEEVSPELLEFSPQGYGWMRVTSNQTDLNAVAINRRRGSGSVAIQNMWGQ